MEKDILIVDHISLVKESIGFENKQYNLIMELGKRLRVRQIKSIRRMNRIKKIFDL